MIIKYIWKDKLRINNLEKKKSVVKGIGLWIDGQEQSTQK